MGEVYKAIDTRLERTVAIKVLPEHVAADPELRQRFEREARTLASLNHPNIAQIHGLERSGGLSALVMELVEGPTLADRIAHGAIPIDEALPIAKQIADALEAFKPLFRKELFLGQPAKVGGVVETRVMTSTIAHIGTISSALSG
jgi:serine/threonine protein kinase